MGDIGKGQLLACFMMIPTCVAFSLLIAACLDRKSGACIALGSLESWPMRLCSIVWRVTRMRVCGAVHSTTLHPHQQVTCLDSVLAMQP